MVATVTFTIPSFTVTGIIDDGVITPPPPPPPPPVEKPPLYPNSVASIDFDFILATDPDFSTGIVALNNGVLIQGLEFPNDPAGGPLIQAGYGFEISYSDTTWKTKVYCHKLFGGSAQSLVYANKLKTALGKIPKIIRENFFYVNIYKGDGTFTSEDKGHFFDFFSVKMDLRLSNHDLEESCFHEGVHAALQFNTPDGTPTGRGVALLNSPGWLAAVAADNAYITDYAKTAMQEDLSESALFAYTVIKNPERLGADLDKVKAQIPNRIAFFRTIFV
jgi:hypothetical protein